MLIRLMPAPAGEHRWGTNYVRQQVNPGEQFRRGNAMRATKRDADDQRDGARPPLDGPRHTDRIG